MKNYIIKLSSEELGFLIAELQILEINYRIDKPKEKLRLEKIQNILQILENAEQIKE